MVIVSRDIAQRCQCRITEEFLGSDHYIVISEIDCMADIAENALPIWRFKHANWELFRQSFSLSLPNIHEQSPDISTLNAQVTVSLLKASKTPIPFSSDDGANNPGYGGITSAKKSSERKKLLITK